jgi:hypothetical protein
MPVAWPALVIGFLFALAAIVLLADDAYHRGLNVHHALQPMLVLGAAAAGIYAHHALHALRLGSFLAFFTVAVLGSLLIVYATMGRQADAREGRQADTRLGNEQHTEIKAELTAAKANRDTECKGKGANGPKCKDWQGRVDALLKQLGGLKTAALDPRAEALGDLATLVGFDRKWTMQVVSAIDPVALPMWLELGSVVFLGAAFPPARKPRRWGRKTEESVTLASESEESVSTLQASDPVPYTELEALADFRCMRSVPSQKVLAIRWARSEPTVSKWLARWASDGYVSRSPRLGRERAVLALAGPRISN